MEQLPSKGIQVQCTMDSWVQECFLDCEFAVIRWGFMPRSQTHKHRWPGWGYQISSSSVPSGCSDHLQNQQQKTKVLLVPQVGTYDLVAQFCATFEESAVEEERCLVDGECTGVSCTSGNLQLHQGKIIIASVAWHWWRAPLAPCQILDIIFWCRHHSPSHKYGLNIVV